MDDTISGFYWILVEFSAPLEFVVIPNEHDDTTSMPVCLRSKICDDVEDEEEEEEGERFM